MSISRSQKAEQLGVIRNWVKELQTLVVINYSGLNVATLAMLRFRLAECRAQLRVFKNRLVKIAFSDHQLQPLTKYLTGANAFVTTQEPNSTVPHVLYQFSQKHPTLKLNCAVYDQKLLSPAALLELASLPSRDELLAMLGGALLAPISLLAATLQAVVSLRSKS